MVALRVPGALALLAALSVQGLGAPDADVDDFDGFVAPLLSSRCVECHSGARPKGRVDLAAVQTRQDLLAQPELIERMVDALEAGDMPPEDEPDLPDGERARLLEELNQLLGEAIAEAVPTKVPIRRLNRLQYSNSVRDLLRLDRDVFRLPERLMTRHSDYLARGPGQMPDRVEVECRSLAEEGGMANVDAYPKDLRAAHGFDNQADQLTLSPLLLDSFLRLSASIVESPDFNEGSVGVWGELIAPPAEGSDLEVELRGRLRTFLTRAFRSPVDDEVLQRYVAHGLMRLEEGSDYSEVMKRLVAASLSSPLFLYRQGASGQGDGEADAFLLASDLSYFLWGSLPSDELLSLAEDGSLTEPEVLRQTVAQMLADPRIEGFLDTFPAQWMQLENTLAATPDPALYRAFHLDNSPPASLQMVLEPLLLFDAVFLENRPVVELLAPAFGYGSRFLESWYRSDLQPPPLDLGAADRDNEARSARVRELEVALEGVRAEGVGLADALPERLRLAQAARDLETQLLEPVARLLAGGGIPAGQSASWGLRAYLDREGQAEWEVLQERLLAYTPVWSTWHRIGPFTAASFDEAHETDFIDPGSIDLDRVHGELRWMDASELVDGTQHTLTGANSATYLRRTLHIGHTPGVDSRHISLSIGSDDSFRIWLDGELVGENKITRGLAPDQDTVVIEVGPGDHELVMKVVNGGGGYGFYFQTPLEPPLALFADIGDGSGAQFWFSNHRTTLPGEVIAALGVEPEARSEEEREVLSSFYHTVTPELAGVREAHAAETTAWQARLVAAEEAHRTAPRPRTYDQMRADARRQYDDQLRAQLRSRTFERVEVSDPRYGGVITNAAVLSMTSGPKRTHPIARGAWLLEVILNDPPEPPPNDVPPLQEDFDPNLTIRERFARHREDPSCAGCHSRLDPLGFALENYDITGRWRDRYANDREVDSSGTLFREHTYPGAQEFKQVLVGQERRFVEAFIAHLFRFALARELGPADRAAVEDLAASTEAGGHKLRDLLEQVALSESFRGLR